MRLNFHDVTLNDKDWIDPLLKLGDRGSLEYNFTTAFVWRNIDCYQIARMDEYFLLRAGTDAPVYQFPAGRGPLAPVISALQEDAAAHGVPLTLNAVLPSGKARLEKAFPGQFTFELDRDTADYVYDTQSLATLSGKKLAAKRNHIHRFIDNHPDWQYEPLSSENLNDVRQMNTVWMMQAGCDPNVDLTDEYCAVESAIRYFHELQLSGGLIRIGGKVVAFSIGDPLNDDTFLVHFEKAFSDVQGAYPLINREFVQRNCMDYAFINREDDAGVPGLRRAKLSYRPIRLVEKYIATAKEPIAP